MMNADACSGRTLAFLGDAVWSLLVRRYLIESGQGKGERLQALAVSYVSAAARAEFYRRLHEEGFWTEEEEGWYRRGRNSTAGSVPKNTPVQVYRQATGFEAVIGALDLEQKRDRLLTVWDKVRTLKEVSS